ncbi:MAG: efflux RND transporter periplasmic adaptor subunit [Planctomycetaceae bacterium]|nr:efflux RND transporter periplasmic adaptor subunit [Planctomycetaceae bacterium]
MNFSLQSTAATITTPPGARDLPQLNRQRPTRRKPSAIKVLTIGLGLALVVAFGVAASVPGTRKTLARLFPKAAAEVIYYEVRPANLPVIVVERGSLESANNVDIFCQVEGQTQIISIVPEGTRVTKGQLVCELDSSALKDQLTNQVIATKGAEAAYQNARLTREVAEIAVIEYVEGIYRQDFQTAKGEIALAESDKTRAEDRLEWSNRMFQKGYVSKAQQIADDLALKKAIFTFEQAQSKLKVLEDYTKKKTIKELESEVEKARSDELAKEQTWSLEKSKQAKLEKQIANCKLFAPGDGLVVYANDPNRFGGSSQPQIEEGATVRERQKIFSLPDISKMRVNTKVHESKIDRLSTGLRARIRVDAFADQVLTGSVESVAPLPDPSNFFSSDIKVYTTLVTIEHGHSGLRPGMTAQVEVLVTELPDVLSVPVQAVLEYQGKDHVAVKTDDGHDWRVVRLGTSNDKLVEVRSGLKAGEVVALHPIALMSEDEKRQAFGSGASSGKDASRKDWGASQGGTVTAVGASGTPGDRSPAGPDAKGGAGGKAKSKAKGKAGAGRMMDPATLEKLKAASPDEQRKILLDRGVPAERVDMILERINSGGGFGGGAPGGGPPGGGFGGGPGGPHP